MELKELERRFGVGFLCWVSKEDFFSYAVEKNIAPEKAEEMFNFYREYSDLATDNLSYNKNFELLPEMPNLEKLSNWTFTDNFADLYERFGGFAPYEMWCVEQSKEIVPLSNDTYPSYLERLFWDIAAFTYHVKGGWKYSEEAPLNPPPRSILPYLTRYEFEIGEGPITIVGDTLDEELPPMTINLSDWPGNRKDSPDGKYYYYILGSKAGPLKECDALPVTKDKYFYCYKTLKIYCGTTLKKEMSPKKFHILRIQSEANEGLYPDPLVIQLVD